MRGAFIFMAKDLRDYEPLSDEDSVKLWFKVEALEQLVSGIIDSMQMHVDNIELFNALTEDFMDYKKETV